MASVEFKWPRASIVRGAVVALCAGGGLSACASVTPMPDNLAGASASQAFGRQDQPSNRNVAQAPAQGGARYKLGAPYQAGGVWYVPAEQPSYNEVGIASWYGDEFNGKPTANGEMFDMNGVSAAHATLPLPSIVEVTNLENGHTLQVRLNDRGPFHPGRIIDLSRGAAQQLGFFNKGTAQVRVRFVSVAPLNGVDETTTTFAANRMHAVLPLEPIAPVQQASNERSHMEVAQSGAGFAVQAGAFSDRGAAERVAMRLATAGRTNIVPLDRGGARLYRVTVGSWLSAQDAGAARERVATLGFSEARVVGGL